MDIDVAALRAFVAVAEFGRFSAAADELGISQQAVSKRIAGLEKALGVPLLRRGHTGTEPTVEGGIALPHARSVLDAAARLTSAVDPRARPLRVDVVGTRLSTVGLVRSFHESRESAGERDIEIVTSNGLRSALPALLRGDIDAAYARVHDLDDPVLDSTPAYLEPVYVVVGRSHQLVEREHVTTAELAGLRAWMPGNAPGSEWADYWDHFADRFDVGFDTDRAFFGMDHLFDQIADADDLVTFVGESTPTHLPRHLGIARIPVVDPVPVYPQSLLWNRDCRHPLLAELVVHTRTHFNLPGHEAWLPEADHAWLHEKGSTAHSPACRSGSSPSVRATSS